MLTPDLFSHEPQCVCVCVFILHTEDYLISSQHRTVAVSAVLLYFCDSGAKLWLSQSIFSASSSPSLFPRLLSLYVSSLYTGMRRVIILFMSLASSCLLRESKQSFLNPVHTHTEPEAGSQDAFGRA